MSEGSSPLWRLWVNTQQRIVSFHPVEGFTLLEFRDQATFFRCIDAYTAQHYRYQ